MTSDKSFRNAEKQFSITFEVEDSIFRENDNDVLESNEQTHEKQLISMIKDKNVISFNKFSSKQLEIIRSFVSFSIQSIFVFFSKSAESQMISEFRRTQINDLMNFMNELMSVKIKKIIDYQSNQFQMTLNRFDDQIEKLHSKMNEFTIFASSASSQRFIFSSILFWERITREAKQFAKQFIRRLAKQSAQSSIFSTQSASDLAIRFFESKFKIENVNFFDSEFQEKSKSFTIVIIVHENKHVFYKDVYVFVERLKNQIKQHDDEIIANLVIVCLRDLALDWYSIKIDEELKITMRVISFDNWCDVFINRFKIRVSVILNHLTIQKYFLNDMKQKVTFKAWFLQMFRYVKTANLFDFFNQFIMIWNRFDVLFRRDISKLNDYITMTRFLQNIDTKISIWYEMIDRQISRQNRQIAYQRQQQFFNDFFYRQQYINRDDQNDNIKFSSKTLADDKFRIYLIEIAQNFFYEYHLNEIEKNEFDENEMSIN